MDNLNICIPGGGVRGIVSSIFLERLEKQGLDLNKVKLFSGVSTGSIISAALCMPNPYKPEEITELYRDLCGYIFDLPWYQPKWLLKGAYGASYDVKKLHECLESHFKGSRLGDVLRPFCVTFYSLDERRGHKRRAQTLFVSNLTPPTEEYLDVKLADLVTASCAAPTYFYPHRFKVGGRWVKAVDGGLVDNTGVLAALATTYELGGCEKLNEMSLLILGNGAKQWHGNAATEPERAWQIPRLAQTLINSIVQSGETMAIHTGRSFLGTRLQNINFSYENPIEIDDVNAIPELEQFAYSTNLLPN